MTTVIPPILLVLDVSVLSSASTRDWLGFSRVGACYLPKIIQEEMRFLHERAPDPDIERVAREFQRFQKTADWKVTDVVAYHPMLKSATGEAYTKRVRVSLAVARCAYGLSQANPTKLVVLVASDRNLLQRIYDMQVPNLCSINGGTLLNWSQAGQRPVAVIQKIQQMRNSGNIPHPRDRSEIPKTQIQTNTRIQSGYPKRTPARNSQIHPDISTPTWLKDMFSIAFALLTMAVAGFVIWLLIAKANSDRANPQSVYRPDSHPYELLA